MKAQKNTNELINLRAMLIDTETKRNHKIYGKDSATVKSKNFDENIGLFVSYILKPVMLAAK